jgi:hypothetical protein
MDRLVRLTDLSARSVPPLPPAPTATAQWQIKVNFRLGWPLSHRWRDICLIDRWWRYVNLRWCSINRCQIEVHCGFLVIAK